MAGVKVIEYTKYLGFKGDPHLASPLFLAHISIVLLENPVCENLPSLQDRRAGSQNQSAVFYLEFISGYCPYQTKPFHQGFFNTLYFSFILL